MQITRFASQLTCGERDTIGFVGGCGNFQMQQASSGCFVYKSEIHKERLTKDVNYKFQAQLLAMPLNSCHYKHSSSCC